jgi:tRNA splicing endonuclease
VGNIIKINMYAEMKRKKDNELKLKTVEEAILEYNSWIKKTNREDKIENYEEFLQAQ